MKNPAVDACIAKSAAFARPIVRHPRTLYFEHKGFAAGMAAFKAHAAFGSWSNRLLKVKLGKDVAKLFPATGVAAAQLDVPELLMP